MNNISPSRMHPSIPSFSLLFSPSRSIQTICENEERKRERRLDKLRRSVKNSIREIEREMKVKVRTSFLRREREREKERKKEREEPESGSKSSQERESCFFLSFIRNFFLHPHFHFFSLSIFTLSNSATLHFRLCLSHD